MEQIDATHADLREIPIDRIERNPENPRIIFRPAELQTLQESIRRYGVQVPVSVYPKKGKYVLIDGERRWRCSLKLNKKTIPALVQAAPTPLNNLLLMFNIHALREQWDLLTIAVKLPRVIALLEGMNNRKATEGEIAEETGLPRSVVRRSKLLMGLPSRFIDQLLGELNKPKSQQTLTEDFFIEMERALKTVERAMPHVITNKDEIRDILIDKYRAGTIPDITDFRYLPKIARAERVEADREAAVSSLRRVFNRNRYSIQQAYEDSVSSAYSERDLTARLEQLLDRLEDLSPRSLDKHAIELLKALFGRIRDILGRVQ